MAERRVGPGRDPSGTSGGADVEPLRGGMSELERGEAGPARAPDTGAAHDPPPGRRGAARPGASERDPAAPYHDAIVPEGGLSAPGAGPTPPPSRGGLEASAGRKVAEERADLEREGGAAHRGDPGARGAGE